MLVVNRSYRELTGLRPVELTERLRVGGRLRGGERSSGWRSSGINSFSYRENYSLLTPANFRRRSRLTPVNSQQAKLAKLVLLINSHQ